MRRVGDWLYCIYTGDAAYCLQNGQLNSKADLIPAGDHLGYVQNSSIRCLPCSLLAAGTRPPGRATRSRRSGRVRTSQYPDTPVLHIPHPTSHIPPTASRGRCLGRCPPTWLALPAAWSPFSRRDDSTHANARAFPRFLRPIVIHRYVSSLELALSPPTVRPTASARENGMSDADLLEFQSGAS